MADLAQFIVGIQSVKERTRHNTEMEKINRMANEAIREQSTRAFKLEKKKFRVEKKGARAARSMSEIRENYIGALTEYTSAQSKVMTQGYADEKKRQAKALEGTDIEIEVAGMKMTQLKKLEKTDPDRYLQLMTEGRAGEDFDNALGMMKLQLDTLGMNLQMAQYKDAKSQERITGLKGLMALFMLPGGTGSDFIEKEIGEGPADELRRSIFGGYLNEAGLLEGVGGRTRDEILKALGYERPSGEGGGKPEAAPPRRSTRPKEKSLPPTEEPISEITEEGIGAEAKSYGLDPIQMETDYPELSGMLKTIKQPAHITSILRAMAWKVPEESILKVLRGKKDDNGK